MKNRFKVIENNEEIAAFTTRQKCEEFIADYADGSSLIQIVHIHSNNIVKTY